MSADKTSLRFGQSDHTAVTPAQRIEAGYGKKASPIDDERRRILLREQRLAREHSCNECGDVWHPGGT